MRILCSLLFLIFCASTATAADPTSTPAQLLIDRIQAALQTKNENAYLALLSSDKSFQTEERTFLREFFTFGYHTAVFRIMEEKEDRVFLHVFLEGSDEARFEAWAITTTTQNEQLLITKRDVISSIHGLYRLRLSNKPIKVRGVQLRHLNALFHLKDGVLLPVMAAGSIAGVFFIGKATFEFSPTQQTEKQQIKLFTKHEKLKTNLRHFYLRASTANINKLFGNALRSNAPSNAKLYDQAQNLLKNYDQTPYSVKIPFTDELWFPHMQTDDLYSELHTSNGRLIYQYAPGEIDDVMLAHRDKKQIISLYSASGFRLATESEDQCSIKTYKMKAAFDPRRTYLSAVSTARINCPKGLAMVVFKLNPDLRVSKIQGDERSLIYFQEEKTANLNVVLNQHTKEDEEIQLQFHYEGKITPEHQRNEAANGAGEKPDKQFSLPASYLYSNRALWYPQLSSQPYLKAEVTITVPDNYIAVANGKLNQTESNANRKTFSYSLSSPAKYLSLFVGQLEGSLTFESIVPIRVYFMNLDKAQARQMAEAADRILRFYSQYFGKYPYENLTLVLRPMQTPGGHSPATISIVNRVYSFMQMRFKRDPLFIPEYPHLLLAHEIAHQWWGQAVGWRTYRDQWLSEGFAQFAAWEFVRQEYGEKAWSKLGKIFFDWVKEKTYAGPLVLGARLGHITNDAQAFTALLYNKGAYVLAMLKNWIGPENFKKVLREFYDSNRFQLVGLSEFQAVVRKHAGTDVDPFLQQWLNGWQIPTVRFTQQQQQRSTGSVLLIRLAQTEDPFYRLKIPVQATSRDGKTFRTIAVMDEPVEELEIPLPFIAKTVEIDPLGETLMKRIDR